MIIKALTILTLATVTLFSAQPAAAMGDKKATQIKAPKPEAEPKIIQPQEPIIEVSETEMVTESEVEEAPQAKPEKRYQQVTRATLSQLYWAMDQMDATRDIDIDNFLLINKCSLYRENYNDDFAWHEIRNNARASLIKHKEDFSRYIEIVQPIYLSRYNVVEQKFPLASKIITSRFEIKAKDEKDWECKDIISGNHIWRYPYRAILGLAKPLELTEIKVPIDLAGKYNSLHARSFDNDTRPAYLVKKLKIFEAKPFWNEYGYKNTATLNAVLEHIDIYGDKRRELLLYSENMRAKKSDILSEGDQAE